MSSDLKSFCRIAGWVLLLTVPSSSMGQDPFELVSELVEIGPRSVGSPGHELSRQLLSRAMESAGLAEVETVLAGDTSSWEHLSGFLAGTTPAEIILSAHYDTVDQSRGALDNASGLAVVIGAAHELVGVPHRSTVRVVLTDDEERQANGARAWLSEVPSGTLQAVLANINVDMVGSRANEGRGVLHLTEGRVGDRRVLTPAWLVHAVIKGAAAADFPLAVLDPRWSWLSQLSVRCTVPARWSDSRAFLEAGIPAVTLSDLALTTRWEHDENQRDTLERINGERLRSWVKVLTAVSRQLDTLEGRPMHETEYLVVGGRVWTRRDMVWVGFVLWVLLVWRGLPGRWRQSGSWERRRAGRIYLPAFAFRMLFLVAVFWVPTFAALLLYPIGVLALLGTVRSAQSRWFLGGLAAAPAFVFSVWLSIGQLAGWFVLDRGIWVPAVLVTLTLATYYSWQFDRPQESTPDT